MTKTDSIFPMTDNDEQRAAIRRRYHAEEVVAPLQQIGRPMSKAEKKAKLEKKRVETLAVNKQTVLHAKPLNAASAHDDEKDILMEDDGARAPLQAHSGNASTRQLPRRIIVEDDE